MKASQLAILDGRCGFAMDTRTASASGSGAALCCNRRQVLQESLLGGGRTFA